MTFLKQTLKTWGGGNLESLKTWKLESLKLKKIKFGLSLIETGQAYKVP